jgi:hypothetical protein
MMALAMQLIFTESDEKPAKKKAVKKK